MKWPVRPRKREGEKAGRREEEKEKANEKAQDLIRRLAARVWLARNTRDCLWPSTRSALLHCTFPMEFPMQFSNAVCAMHFSNAVSNAVCAMHFSNAVFQCSLCNALFQCSFQCSFSAQSRMHFCKAKANGAPPRLASSWRP